MEHLSYGKRTWNVLLSLLTLSFSWIHSAKCRFQWQQINDCYLELECTMHYIYSIHHNFNIHGWHADSGGKYWKAPLARTSMKCKCKAMKRVFILGFSIVKLSVCCCCYTKKPKRGKSKKKWQPETINSKRKSKIDLHSSSLWYYMHMFINRGHTHTLSQKPS